VTKQDDFYSSMLKSRSKRAKRGPKCACRMMAVLSIKQRWVTRKEFAEQHRFSSDGRECRLGRECANGRIIQSHLGYKLLKLATPEEIRISLGVFKKQRDAADKEYGKLCRRAHRFLHTERATA